MKFVLRSLACVAAAAILLATVSSDAGENKKKPTTGAVVKVDAENLTIKVKEKKKDGVVVSPAKDVSFKLNASTKVEKAGKKDEPATPAAIADVQVGVNVAVLGAEGGVAEKVTILKKKNN